MGTKFDLENKVMDANIKIEILTIYLCAFMKRKEYSFYPIPNHPSKAQAMNISNVRLNNLGLVKHA